MHTKRDVLVLARNMGARVIYGGRGANFEILVDAPDGYHWADGGVYELVVAQWSKDDVHPQAELWDDTYNRMICGLEPCDEQCGHLEE